MHSKQKSAAVLQVLVQFTGCFCAVLLAVCLALQLTLLKEGHYAGSLEKSGYLGYVQQVLEQNCGNLAAEAGLSAQPVQAQITPEAVRAGVLHRADALWRGPTEDETDPFGALDDAYAAEPENDPVEVLALQMACEQEWHADTVIPFSAALAVVLQYQKVVLFAAWFCTVLLAGCCAVQFLLAANWAEVRAGLANIALGSLAAGIALALGIYFAADWQHWMPSSDPAYAAFCRWFAAFPIGIPVCSAAIALALWAAGSLMQKEIKTRTPGQKE